jgi:hypothetical protein
MVPCPCCKATNDTGPACRRCKADLMLLFQLEADRAALIAAGDFERAHQLRRGNDTLQHIAAAKLLARDFAGALAAYHERTPAP